VSLRCRRWQGGGGRAALPRKGKDRWSHCPTNSLWVGTEERVHGQSGGQILSPARRDGRKAEYCSVKPGGLDGAKKQKGKMGSLGGRRIAKKEGGESLTTQAATEGSALGRQRFVPQKEPTVVKSKMGGKLCVGAMSA